MINIFHICLVGNSYVGLHFYVFWLNCAKSLKIHKEKGREVEQNKRNVKVVGKKALWALGGFFGSNSWQKEQSK